MNLRPATEKDIGKIYLLKSVFATCGVFLLLYLCTQVVQPTITLHHCAVLRLMLYEFVLVGVCIRND